MLGEQQRTQSGVEVVGWRRTLRKTENKSLRGQGPLTITSYPHANRMQEEEEDGWVKGR